MCVDFFNSHKAQLFDHKHEKNCFLSFPDVVGG